MSDPEDLIDDIKNTLYESYSQSLDVQGPNWEWIARQVFEKYVAPLQVENAHVENLRSQLEARVENAEMLA